MKQSEFNQLLDMLLNDELSYIGKTKLKRYIDNYDFDEILKLRTENEVLKAKIFTYEEIIKKSNFSPFVINIENNLEIESRK